MEFYLTTYDGRKAALPTPVSWEFSYTGGVPCDSFSVCCVYDGSGESLYSDATRFTAMQGAETVFYGVVDEYTLFAGVRGRTVTLGGRGMAALLLDNHAIPGEYQAAGIDDILARHVTPYGITVADRGSIPARNAYTVSAGSSEWQALYDFTHGSAGITPRFDRAGRLLLSGWKDDGRRIVLNTGVAVSSCSYRERRYGVCSEVLVRDKTRNVTHRFTNDTFLERGGCRRRVITTPGRSNYETMKYSGTYQLSQSAEELLQVTLTVPQMLFAQPGEIACLSGAMPGITGEFRVTAVTTGADEGGAYTTLTLGARNSV